MILPLIACEMDLIAALSGLRTGEIALTCIFIAIFVIALTVALVGIIQYILTLRKSRELESQISRLEAEKKAIEAELTESRVSMMISQIQPHFIYNMLGTIEQLCLKNPQMASELVRNFSLYLRADFIELDSATPISFSEEIKHVQYYVNIEKVCFPDITIEYQLDTSDFFLPAISVQPLVENAIKHGLMPLESGGRVVIRSYQTDTHFCVEVTDNGVGFDTDRMIDKKEHVGLYNVRERLKAIVNGELRVESAEGTGTTATILIPKEKTV